MKHINIAITTSLALSLLSGCASKAPNDYTTEVDTIFLNSPDDAKNCKYIGPAHIDGLEDWKERLLKVASQKGATHVYSAEPEAVARDPKNIQLKASLYRCPVKTS